jgi:hypothetical protein
MAYDLSGRNPGMRQRMRIGCLFFDHNHRNGKLTVAAKISPPEAGNIKHFFQLIIQDQIKWVHERLHAENNANFAANPDFRPLSD